MNELTKFCTGCSKELPATNEFFPKAKNASGLYSRCKECKKISMQKWKDENPEKVAETEKRKYERKKASGYYQSDKVRETNKKNKQKAKEKDPEKFSLDAKKAYLKWKESNPEKLKEIKRASYLKATNNNVSWTKKKTSPEQRRAYRQKYLLNPQNRLIKRFRAIVRKHLFVPYGKTTKTQEVLGCSFEEFRNHIETLFKNGMSWDRISEIHLDHKIPISSATSKEDIIKLNHYTNLQPLWAIDNLKKGARLDTIFN